MNAGTENYKWIIRKKKKKHDKILKLGKHKINATEVLISKALIDLCISHDKFVSVNNVLRKYYEMKKNPKKTLKKKLLKILKLLWNTIYKNNGNLLCLLQKKILLTKIQLSKKTKQKRLMLLSNCAVSGKKKSTFI